MKEVYEILQQKEADLAHVRDEIEALRIVGALLSNESLPKDAFERLPGGLGCRFAVIPGNDPDGEIGFCIHGMTLTGLNILF